MKRYLSLSPSTATRCFHSHPRHLHDKHEGHTDFRAPKPKEGDDLSKDDTNWLSDGMEFGLDEETSVSQDIQAGLSPEYSQSTDPFSVFDAPISTPTNVADFLKELELFDQGALLSPKSKCPVSTPGANGRFGDGGRGAPVRDEGHKPRVKVPVHLDEKYRYLTRRDKELYAKEAPRLEAMREKARKMQREWAAQQPPPTPKASNPPDPVHEPASLGEIPYTAPTSLPTPRQLESLPQSPLLRPIPSFWSDKAYKPKAPASEPEDWTPFQRKLHRNPYALSLASPVRRCLITKIRLPRDFLISFEMMTNPADGRSWFLPRDLSMPVPDAQLRVRVSKPQAESELIPEDQNTTTDEVEEAGYEQGTNTRLRTTPRYYLLSTHKFLSHTTQKSPPSPLPSPQSANPTKRPPTNPYFGSWAIMNHLSHVPGEKRNKGEWRADMPDFVLGLIRKRVVTALWKGLFKKDKFVQYKPTWEDIVKQKQMGCVLWLGQEELFPTLRDESPEAKEEFEEAIKKEAEWGPAPYTTISNPPFWTRKLPVFNALRLLGGEGVREIRGRGPPVDTKRYIVIKDKPDTVEVRRWLWKIENYMAEYEMEKSDLGKWEPRDDEEDAGEDVEFETVYVPEDEEDSQDVKEWSIGRRR